MCNVNITVSETGHAQCTHTRQGHFSLLEYSDIDLLHSWLVAIFRRLTDVCFFYIYSEIGPLSQKVGQIKKGSVFTYLDMSTEGDWISTCTYINTKSLASHLALKYLTQFQGFYIMQYSSFVKRVLISNMDQFLTVWIWINSR